MLESTPGSPYTGCLVDILSVEEDMRYRYAESFSREHTFLMVTTTSRRLARKYLKPDEIPYTLTSFPRLGVPGVFTDPYFDPADAKSSHSLFLPEEITNPHARFPSVESRIHQHILALSPLILQHTNGKYSAATWFEGGHKPPIVH